MSTKSWYQTNETELVNYLGMRKKFLQSILHLSKFSFFLQAFDMCPSSCSLDVQSIFQLRPYTAVTIRVWTLSISYKINTYPHKSKQRFVQHDQSISKGNSYSKHPSHLQTNEDVPELVRILWILAVPIPEKLIIH